MARTSLIGFALLGLACSFAVGCSSGAEEGGDEVEASEAAITQGLEGPISPGVYEYITSFTVVAPALECRSRAGTQFPRVASLPGGAVVERGEDDGPGAEVVRYSSEGNPWLRVLAGGRPCYVAANYKFIQPTSAAMGIAAVREHWVYDVIGEVNCRAEPNVTGRIDRVHVRGEVIWSERDEDGMTTYAIAANGRPWLKTDKGCWVAASYAFLQPLDESEEPGEGLIDR